jgi:hypothetical protein
MELFFIMFHILFIFHMYTHIYVLYIYMLCSSNIRETKIVYKKQYLFDFKITTSGVFTYSFTEILKIHASKHYGNSKWKFHPGCQKEEPSYGNIN